MPRGRIELPTRGFSVLCSTTELPRHRISNFLDINKFISKKQEDYFKNILTSLLVKVNFFKNNPHFADC